MDARTLWKTLNPARAHLSAGARAACSANHKQNGPGSKPDPFVFQPLGVDPEVDGSALSGRLDELADRVNAIIDRRQRVLGDAGDEIRNRRKLSDVGLERALGVVVLLLDEFLHALGR